MALSAVETIQRGLVNTRANWELVLVQFLQILLATVLMIAGLLPPLAVLGFADLDLSSSHVEDLSALMVSASDLLARGKEAWALLLAAVAVTLGIWMMALLVHCFFQGGIYGVLMAGDRQAPPGKPRTWSFFRTFSVRDLRGWGSRYLWRYFWLLNLFFAIATLWLLLPMGLASAALWIDARWGGAAGLGFGCGGILLFLFSAFVLAFWLSLAQADLAREESSVWSATRQGLQVLSRRLGAVILVAVVGMLASLTLSAMVMAFSLLGQLGLGSSLASQVGWMVVVNVTQLVLSCSVGVAFIAVLIALARSEAPVGARA
jgi:hypothetical protein